MQKMSERFNVYNKNIANCLNNPTKNERNIDSASSFILFTHFLRFFQVDFTHFMKIFEADFTHFMKIFEADFTHF